MRTYREVGVLAEGGMAVIALAERDDGCAVVIKRVRPPFCFDQSFLRLFADEGAVNAALDHENIVRLLDRGEDAAGPYLVFEHVDGTDLGIVLEATKAPLELECILAVALPMFRGLAAAHDAKDTNGTPLKVVHRDISPGNVLIGSDGGVKLADFGVASFTLKTELTVAGEMKGKFAYMAPEQTRGEKVGPRADLFAAGVVLWEALAGKRLFDGPTDADVVAAVRNTEAPPLEGPLGPLIAALLAKEPDERPASASDVVKQLAELASSLGLDEGLSRHAARLARASPRGAVKVRDMDARRRTQRVVVDGNAPTIVRRRSSRAPIYAAAGAFVAAIVGVVWFTHDADVTTALPPSPPPPDTATLASTQPTADPAHGLATAHELASTHADPTPHELASTHADPAHGLASTHADPAHEVASTHENPAHAAATTAHPASTTAHAASTPASTAKAAVAEGFGKLTITTDPWASVTIDGKLVVKETPLKGFTLAAGAHSVVLDNPYYGKKTIDVTIPADGDVHRFVDLNQP